METTPVSNRMYGLAVLYEMNTDFFNRVLDGISDEDAHNRLNTKANHIAWITGSLVYERYELAKELGIDLSPSTAELHKDHKGIQDGAQYPSLSEYKKDWENISALLLEALQKVSDERLDKPFEMPGESMSFFDLISFMAYRESNCIGQIALWRRLLGYDAMKYQ